MLELLLQSLKSRRVELSADARMLISKAEQDHVLWTFSHHVRRLPRRAEEAQGV